MPSLLTAGTFVKDLSLNSTGGDQGNLIHPLSWFQLFGIWPIGDFRRTAPTVSSAVLIGAVIVAAAAGLWLSVRRRQPGVALYVAVALAGCGIVYFSGGTPWVTGRLRAWAMSGVMSPPLIPR